MCQDFLDSFDICFFSYDNSGVSSFNQFVHELSVDSDTSSADYSSGEEDFDGIVPASPSSYGSRFSRASNSFKYERHRTGWIMYIISWMLFPAKFLLGIPLFLGRLWEKSPSVSHEPLHLRTIKKAHALKDHVVHRTTDRRRGVIEVCESIIYLSSGLLGY